MNCHVGHVGWGQGTVLETRSTSINRKDGDEEEGSLLPSWLAASQTLSSLPAMSRGFTMCLVHALMSEGVGMQVCSVPLLKTQKVKCYVTSPLIV